VSRNDSSILASLYPDRSQKTSVRCRLGAPDDGSFPAANASPQIPVKPPPNASPAVPLGLRVAAPLAVALGGILRASVKAAGSGTGRGLAG